VSTPGASAIADVVASINGSGNMNFAAGQTLKSVVLMQTALDGTRTPVVIGLPGNRDVDLKRVEAALHPATVVPFEDVDFAQYPALIKGFIGPQVLGDDSASGITFLVDPRVVTGSTWITGANEIDKHVVNVVAGRDFSWDGVIEAAAVLEGDACSSCDSPLSIARGIEIGHIFQLGRKYAEALDLKVLDESGSLVTVTMGSYGIGVSRAVAAIAEQSHDEKGLIWPREVSPADVHIIATGKDDAPFEAAESLASELETRGMRVLFDDRRGVSPGVKFNDSELLGVPTIVVIGRSLADGLIEVRNRRTGEQQLLGVESVANSLVDLIASS